jgi:hypothetical protein
MGKFFCAEGAREAAEDMIGTAFGCQTYVLIECPTPWAFSAFDSPAIPQNLRDLAAQVNQTHPSLRFLLITGNECDRFHHDRNLHDRKQTRVIIYDRSSETFCRGYDRYEVLIENLEQASDVISAFLINALPLSKAVYSSMHVSDVSMKTDELVKDVLVCTHGSHDQCCAKYGIPFYRQAIAQVAEQHLPNVRIWKASHFGGHRFAPTAITFPDGRYYGGLDAKSLISILTQTGNIDCFQRVYRGWSILPTEVQVLEQNLLLQDGWDWLSYPLSYQVIKQSEEKRRTQVSMTVIKKDGLMHQYESEIVQDDCKTMCLKGSCHAVQAATFFKYTVTNLCLRSITPVSISPLVPSTNPDTQNNGINQGNPAIAPAPKTPTSRKTPKPLTVPLP